MWVPIAVGLLGLCGVLGAQLIAGWREDRRWRREVQREDVRWQRERERLRDERRYAGREEAYGRIVGLLEAWQWVLHPAKERVLKRGGVLDAATRAALERMREAASDALGPINLHAPDEIRHLMRDAVLSKVRLTDALLALPDPAGDGDFDGTGGDGGGDAGGGGDGGGDGGAGGRRTELYREYRASLDHYTAMRAAMRRDLGVDASA